MFISVRHASAGLLLCIHRSVVTLCHGYHVNRLRYIAVTPMLRGNQRIPGRKVSYPKVVLLLAPDFELGQFH